MNGADTNFKTYANETFGVSIQYPTNWIILETDMNPADTLVTAVFATSLEYLSNRESDGAPPFSVWVNSFPPNMTIFNYAKNVSNLFNSGGFSNEIHFNGVTLANSPAYEIQATYGIPGEAAI